MKEELKGFAQRLAEACDNHPDAPAPHKGRQTWVANKVGVSNEAVRKWFSALTLPKPKTMAKLAQILGVDEAWLALGITPVKQPKELAVAERQSGGAVYYVAGLIEMDGGVVAFPEAADVAEGVDLFATFRGRQKRIHVVLAERTEPGRYQVMLPPDTDRVMVLAVVMGGSHASRRVLFMPPDMIRTHAEVFGGYRQVEMIADDGEFTTSGDVWPEVQAFRDLAGALQQAV